MPGTRNTFLSIARQRMLLLTTVAVITTLVLTPTSAGAAEAAEQDSERDLTISVNLSEDGLNIDLPLSPYAPRSDRHRPWTWTFAPFGTIHGFQNGELHPTTWWDHGTTMHVQFGRGRGHAVWFGVAYREAAGFSTSDRITSFDPRHIDTAQLLTWRYQLGRRHTLFTHWERWCYHEIDIRATTNPFWTNGTIGYGTVSPPEAWAMGLRRAYRSGKPQLDGYLYAGPMIHGGPADILGNWPRWQGKGRAWAALAYPVKGYFVMELALAWEAILLRKSEAVPLRHKGDARLTAMVVRRHGAVTLFGGYRFHDDIPFRTCPASTYLGIGFRI